MELVCSLIDINLKELIIKSYNQIESKLNEKNDRTHHLNIYHRNWETKDIFPLGSPSRDIFPLGSPFIPLKILSLLEKDYNIPSNKVISLGFISSQVKCKEQHFHIDYKGGTHTYFIPLCNLTDKNGTEYLEFNSVNKNISLFENLKEIGDKFITREGVSSYLSSINVSKDEYSFKILNGTAFSLVYLPNYVLHRGTENKEDYIKVMFQIIMEAVENATVSSKIEHKDSELDEDDDIVSILISSRKDNEN